MEEKVFSRLEAHLPSGEYDVIGKVIQLLGGRRFRVYCSDGKERVCTLCNKSRFVKIKPNYLVLLKKWIGSSGENKGTIVHVYTPRDFVELTEKGYLKFLQNRKI